MLQFFAASLSIPIDFCDFMNGRGKEDTLEFGSVLQGVSGFVTTLTPPLTFDRVVQS